MKKLWPPKIKGSKTQKNKPPNTTKVNAQNTQNILFKLDKSSLKCKGKGAAKKSSKKNTFFLITKHVFFIFLHFDPSYFICA